jgi:hypothetical protein
MTGTARGDGGRFTRFFERMNGRLKPALGPAMIGPFDSNRRIPTGPCPVCGEKMSDHAIEHTESDTILYCPAAAAPTKDSFVRLSMLDMPAMRARRVRAGSR